MGWVGFGPGRVEVKKSRRFEVSEGHPAPFGATAVDGGVNFAIFSGHAVSATLCLINLSDLQKNRITELIPLDPETNRTGNIWHVFLEGNFDDMLYGYQFDGPFCPHEGHHYNSSRVLVDPCAKRSVLPCSLVVSGGNFGVAGPDGNCWPQMAGMIPSPNDEDMFLPLTMYFFQNDWEGDLPLQYPQSDLVLYEMHVRGFTLDESSRTKHRELGVNCIELMPCHELSSTMMRYSASGIRNCGRSAINEFKLLVRVAHKRGLEGEFYKYSGCGNTFKCNHPVVRQFIVDCLRYWVTEMHIDGFRFDLASILTRACSLSLRHGIVEAFIKLACFLTGAFGLNGMESPTLRGAEN
ncbi:Isoamylase 1, chloroplastic-like protein [Drosera capensis]